MTVAPAWGRGLKSFAERQQWVIDNSRPRMGAWIEMGYSCREYGTHIVAPAWGRGLKSHPITCSAVGCYVAPAWGRGLKLKIPSPLLLVAQVAPAWGRGLKFLLIQLRFLDHCRPRMGAWIEMPPEILKTATKP